MMELYRSLQNCRQRVRNSLEISYSPLRNLVEISPLKSELSGNCCDLAGDVTQSQLVKYLEYCIGLTGLSLLTTEIDPKKFGKVLLSMGNVPQNLQRLDVCCHDIQALLEVISVNLEEITIRKEPNSNWNGKVIGPWVCQKSLLHKSQHCHSTWSVDFWYLFSVAATTCSIRYCPSNCNT